MAFGTRDNKHELMATGRYVVEGVGGMTLRRVQEALNEGSDKG